MDTDRRTRHLKDRTRRSARPKPFLGVRHPAAKAVLALVVLAAIGLGARAVHNRYVLKPRREEAIHSGEADKRLYERWQRMGPGGWERLFEEAAKGHPGYSVDTGLPARRKLVELGAEIVPLANNKLDDADQATRLTAIYVLGAVGEPQDRIADLLINEGKGARNHSEAVAAVKCANALSDPILERVSFAALNPPYQKARAVAAEHLLYLARKPGADPALRQRLDELRRAGDVKVRIEFAMQALDAAPVETYNLLLEMLASGDEEVRTLAVGHVARLRDGDPIRDNTPPGAIPGIIERHRYYLRTAIAAARVNEDEAAAYRALDEGINSDNKQMVRGVANLVAALRGTEHLSEARPDLDEQIAEHRDWVRTQLARTTDAVHPE